MKKIAKFTWLYNDNYGTLLQAYALQKIIQNEGYQIIDINYRASNITKLLNLITSRNSLSLFLEKFQNRKCDKLLKNRFLNRTKKNKDFINKNIMTTDLVTNKRELKKLLNSYDILICGSDQIWSPKLFNPPYYFSFVKDNIKKIAYAPSFGNITTTNWKKNKITNYLSRFDFISTRENEGRVFIHELCKIDAKVVLDPTFLIDRETWEGKAIEFKNKKKYAVCYLLTYNHLYVEAIKKYCDERKVELIIIPSKNSKFSNYYRQEIEIDPFEWIGIIKSSEIVFTDSYHCCIFSIIFNKKFYLFKRFDDKNICSQNSRIYTLAETFKIHDRIIDSKTFFKLNDGVISYDDINHILKVKIEESKGWLFDCLKKVC